MKNVLLITLAASLLHSLPAQARPGGGTRQQPTVQRTQTGPGSYSTSASGSHGGQFNSSSNVRPTATGVRATGQASGTGPRGTTASGNGVVQGNQQSGSVQGQGRVQGANGGQASGQTTGTWENGTYNGSSSGQATGPNGQTGSASSQSTYTQGQGGTTTVTNGQGQSKTVTVPPKP
jgi:translation initiation factor IF-2